MADPTRYTTLASEALIRAELEAKQRHSATIEAEHLFLALWVSENGVGADILHQDLSLETAQVKAVIDLVSEKFGDSSAGVDVKPIASSSFNDVLFWAAQEARYANHHFIGTEHLLLGLSATNDRLMREIFKRLKLRPEDVRAKVHARIPEIPLQVNRWAKLRDRIRTEFYHNFAYYVPQPIRKLFGRVLDSSKMPPLG